MDSGRTGGKAALLFFLEDALRGYRTRRDFPGGRHTSRLSPHLALGEISPLQICMPWWRQKRPSHRGHGSFPQGTRLARILLASSVSLSRSGKQGVQFPLYRFRWDFDERAFRRAGRAASPATRSSTPDARALADRLDAQSRPHDRRLIPHQGPDDRLAPWRAMVSRHAGGRRPCIQCRHWQWVAGSGADAAPYFRIFNPVLQGEKFDPQGDYIRRYVPEIAGSAMMRSKSRSRPARRPSTRRKSVWASPTRAPWSTMAPRATGRSGPMTT